MAKMKTLAFYKTAMLLTTLLLLVFSCKKEEPGWQRCDACSSDLILGDYSGTATHYRYTDTVNFVATNSNEVYLNITEEGSSLHLQTGVVNLFSANLTGVYENTYYLSFAGSNQQLNGTIWIKDAQVRITGTVKKTATVNGQSQLLELFDFEVFKQ